MLEIASLVDANESRYSLAVAQSSTNYQKRWKEVEMRICMISKFPPIEGGESSKAYWLARELGNRGHAIHVVTNALDVEDAYKECFRVEDISGYQP